MAQSKYIVLRNVDAQKYLSPAQNEALVGIMRTIGEGRRKENKPFVYFILDMADQYALPAIEAYITGIQMEGLASAHLAVQDALDRAIEARQTGLLNVEQHLPD